MQSRNVHVVFSLTPIGESSMIGIFHKYFFLLLKKKSYAKFRLDYFQFCKQPALEMIKQNLKEDKS